MSVLRYISHPAVNIDPDVPVPDWGLSPEGQLQAEAMLEQPWVASITRIISSSERKALEAAEVLANYLELEVEIRPETGETDRSSTGYVSDKRHEALADQFFASPTESAEGWETALDAQLRMVDALRDLIRRPPRNETRLGDVAVIGHGGVGTLLMTHLAGLETSREHDQPGAGHYWSLNRRTGDVLHHWLPIVPV
ncbi:MAG: broad specificity phosphatase PhoE [Candidatus Poriferisodalaceae bacterium]|jgi:broad specificity phosphatase PhoE